MLQPVVRQEKKEKEVVGLIYTGRVFGNEGTKKSPAFISRAFVQRDIMIYGYLLSSVLFILFSRAFPIASAHDNAWPLGSLHLMPFRC